jgi:hypothetical protein
MDGFLVSVEELYDPSLKGPSSLTYERVRQMRGAAPATEKVLVSSGA